MSRYLYVMCQVDQTVKCIDANAATGSGDMSAAITTSVTLPTNVSLGLGPTPLLFGSLNYRSSDKRVYTFSTDLNHFGEGYVSVIDADPTSGTFNTIVETVHCNNLRQDNNHSVVYSLINDTFYLGEQNYDPIAKVTYERFNIYNQSDATVDQHGRNYYDDTSGRIIGGLRDKVSHNVIPNATLGYLGNGNAFNWGEMVYDSVNNRYYINATSQVIVVDPANFNRTKIITTESGVRISGICIAGRKLFLGSSTTNLVGVINLTNDTYTGSFAKTNLGASEDSSRTFLYSASSDRVFIQAANTGSATTGVNKLHVINPNLSLGSMETGFITVGNMEADLNGNKSINQMCLNALHE